MGLVGHVVDPAELDERTRSASRRDRLRRAALAGRQQAHPARAALAAAALAPDVERELIELRESLLRSEDFPEGVRAFGEKRRPVWRGARAACRPFAGLDAERCTCVGDLHAGAITDVRRAVAEDLAGLRPRAPP